MRNRSSASLSFQLTLAIGLVAALGALLIAAFATWSAAKIDRDAAARERTLVQRSISERLEDMQREQESLTTWDDAVTHAQAHDWPWISENIGVYMNSMFKHDESYVLSPSDEPVYAAVDGSAAGLDRARVPVSSAMSLVKALRQKMAAAQTLTGLGAADIVEIGDQPCLVSVKPILPFTGAVTQERGKEFLHISIVRIGDKLLSELGSRQLITHLHYQSHPPSDVEGSIDIGGQGTKFGYAVWDRDRPGMNLLTRTAPVLGLAFLGFVALVGALIARLRSVADKLSRSQARAEHIAYHDALTGLPNRAFCNDRLSQAVADPSQGSTVALLYIDLDRFKNVNDTLGHPAGDELIRQVASRLRAIVPSNGFIARLGGDEFAVLHHFADPQDARALGESIVTTMGKPFDLGGDQAVVSASVGISFSSPAGVDPDELMRRADIALYEAKGKGKSRCCVFAPSLGEIVKQKRRVERDLRESLEGGGVGFHLAFQPLFAADGTSVAGAEALLRWSHPSHGDISPAVFIPIAEERGLIVDLGDWVLREACRSLRELELPWLAVNVSAVQLREPSFPLKLMALLAEYGLTPNRFQIEITESVLLDPSGQTAASIQHLREAGIRVALDDFGTGYSSLQYLHRYAVDKIKIDKSFVQDLSTSESSRAIVMAMIGLARAFGMEVTAEGVETEAQWTALQQLGCSELQGYLFAKPMSAAAFPAVSGRADRKISLSGPLRQVS